MSRRRREPAHIPGLYRAEIPLGGDVETDRPDHLGAEEPAEERGPARFVLAIEILLGQRRFIQIGQAMP